VNSGVVRSFAFVSLAGLVVGCGSGSPDALSGDEGTTNTTDGGGSQPGDAAAVPTADGGMSEKSQATTIALTGCPSSGYAATFTVGGQPFDLIVDTGSGNLAVASSDCPSCAAAGVSQVYTPGSMATDQGRVVNSQYGIGMWTGELYRDQVGLMGTSLTTSMNFVAIHSEEQFFSPSGCNFGAVPFAPEGIVGFGPTRLASSMADVFMNRVVADGLVPNLFAVELCPLGGQLWIGAIDAQAAATSDATLFTPITASGFYSVTLDDLQLGGQSMGFSASDFGTTIVDTGTTVLALPEPVFTALTSTITSNSVFVSSFPAASGNWLSGQDNQSSCFESTHSGADLDAMLPGITFVMPGTGGGAISVSLTATESYLQPVQYTMNGANKTYYCGGLLPNTQRTTTTILGAAAMSAHLVVFDGVNNQIGFAPQTHCK